MLAYQDMETRILLQHFDSTSFKGVIPLFDKEYHVKKIVIVIKKIHSFNHTRYVNMKCDIPMYLFCFQDDSFLVTVVKEREEELSKKTLLALNDMRIKFPGKSDQEAEMILDRVSVLQTIWMQTIQKLTIQIVIHT